MNSFKQNLRLLFNVRFLVNAISKGMVHLLRMRLLLLLILLIPLHLFSQAKPKRTRILFLLDASSSMTYPWNGAYNRFEIASNILLKIMDSVYSINNEIEFGVRAYGTMYPAQKVNCIDTKLEVPFNMQNTNQIKTRLKNISPIGSSPIAYSLKQASEGELSDMQHYDYSIIFITDGGESCNGDVCGVYQELLQKKISIKPYIIGLDNTNELLKTYYACLGNYIDVSTAEDIDKAVSLIVNANKSIIEKPKQFNLVTTYSNTKPIIDSVIVKKIEKIDTIVPPPIVIDTPKVKRGIFTFSGLRLRRLAKQKNEIAVININAKKFEKVNSVTLNFDLQEPKKTAPVFALMMPRYITSKTKQSKSNILVKKANLKMAKKAILHFEYEEAKKVSPGLVLLSVFYSTKKLASGSPSIAIKKSNIKLAKKASIRLEYEEPKKVSPAFASMTPLFKKIQLPQSKASIVSKKPNWKIAKNTSIRLEYEEPIKYLMAVIKYRNYPRRYSYAFKMPDMKKFDMAKRKAVLHFTVEEKKAVAKKDTVIAPSTLPLGTTVEFTTKSEPSKETKVQVYFKGNNGKTYPNAKPQILLQNVVTNQTVNSFKREMVGDEPIAQPATPGTYNLVIKGFDDLYANNIEIRPNTITKVYIKVNDGTLQFRYKGNINRPISEYTAIVNRRFAAGATVTQKCSETKSYDPGTYYVEINCLPPYKGVIDLTFDATYEIQIDEPGTLAIMNSEALGKIQIQYMLGDQFVTFYTMNVTGDVNKQRVQLLSNTPLKIVYPEDPKMPMTGNKVLPFRLKPNNTMELELK